MPRAASGPSPPIPAAFRLPGLPPGIYRVEISCAGFACRVLGDVQISADAVTTVQETLSTAGISEQVTVVATGRSCYKPRGPP